MIAGKPKLEGCQVLPPMSSTSKPKTVEKAPKDWQAAPRFKTINAFCDFTMANLDRAALAVWLLLWRNTKPDGIARMSQAELSRRAGVTLRTVERAVKQLVGLGLLVVVRQGGPNRGVSHYRAVPLIPQKPTDMGAGIATDMERQKLPTPVSDCP